jgi:uncharacterized repeat protein (TIGR03803 family)
MKILPFFFIAFLFLNTNYSQTPELWGMTSAGGADNKGTIFKTDTNGQNHQVLYSFKALKGSSPHYIKLCEASNGKLYGVTRNGGASNFGILFEYDTITHVFKEKIEFSGVTNGSYPEGGLIQASNGKMYGLTSRGGVNNLGVLYEYDPILNTLINKIDFDGSLKGKWPKGSLFEANNGKLYGMTSLGGTSDAGVIFEYDIMLNTLIKAHDFNFTGGGYPAGNLTQANNGELYGLAQSGGANNDGVLFSYNIVTSTYIKRADFNEVTSGKYPKGGLLEASDGMLYGMTEFGGVNGDGVLFYYDIISDTIIKKINFDGANTGRNPYGDLIEDSIGKLYGLTSSGGTNYDGALFEYNISTSTLIKKKNFDWNSTGGRPYGTLLKSSNGKLYGVAKDGGLNNVGTLFEYNTTTDSLIKRVDLGNSINGSAPQGSLFEASNGKLYGMTNQGGKYNKGVLFEFNRNTRSLTVLLDFDGVNNGSNPSGSLMQAFNGDLYGLTASGGANSYGVLFSYNTTTNTYLKRFDFSSVLNCGSPQGNLIEASNGLFYGLAASGGVNYKGALFEYNTVTDTLIVKIDFNGAGNGSLPRGSLLEASNGKLYGITRQGGANDKGMLFEYNIVANSLINKVDFNGAVNGLLPTAGLIEASNGKLYGMTPSGGANSKGVLYTYNTVTDTLIVKINFDGINGSNSAGSLIESSNDRLYGGAYGGTSSSGVLFEYNTVTDTLIKTLDFNSTNGAYPNYGHLIEIMSCVKTYSNLTVSNCGSLVSSSGKVFDTTGVYADTIPNSVGCDSIITFNLTVLAKVYDTITDTLCDSYQISGVWYINDTIVNDTINNGAANGCDSITTFSLSFNYSTIDTITNSICDSMQTVGGKTINTTGIYRDTLTSITGCDSVLIYDIVVKQSTYETITETTCDSFVSPNGKVWDTTGIYTDTINNVANCDSVITFNITITKSTYETITETTCDSFVSPNGKVWDTTGIYTDTINNVANCDSVITFNLTVVKSTYETITETTCDSFVSPNGKVWDTTGIYTDTINNVANCDSVITFNLTVNYFSVGSETKTICIGDSVLIVGNWYYSNTVINDTLTGGNATMCDSITTYTIVLDSVNPKLNLGADVTLCDFDSVVLQGGVYDSYLWSTSDTTNTIVANGTVLGVSNNNYWLEVTQSNGCKDRDSISVVFSNCVGINEAISKGLINVYPNPTLGMFTINFGTIKGKYQLQIIDASGREISRKERNNEAEITINLKEERGIYIVRIIDEQSNITTVRVIKE